MDKSTILNQIVSNAATLMEIKADSLQCIAEQYEEKGDLERAAMWREDIPAILAAVALMQKLSGCWA